MENKKNTEIDAIDYIEQDLFQEVSVLDVMKAEIACVKESADKVRKRLFAELKQKNDTIVQLNQRLDKIESVLFCKIVPIKNAPTYKRGRDNTNVVAMVK